MFQPQPTPFASTTFSSAYIFAPNLTPPSSQSHPPDDLIDPGFDFACQFSYPRGGIGPGSGPGPGPNLSPTSSTSDSGAYRSVDTVSRNSPTTSLVYVSPASSSTSTHHHISQSQRVRHQTPLLHEQQHNQSRLVKMEDQGGRHSITAQQAAAKDYRPTYDGQLGVGDVISSDAITDEYAKADPVYVEKTVNLPQKFSHYRPIRGDGNCGWRAIGFSYFEKLVEKGNRSTVLDELNRLITFNQMLSTVGGYGYWEDFSGQFIALMREVLDAMGNLGLAHQLIVQRWNDTDTSNACLYYLRMISATYLKIHAAEYDPFLTDDRGIADFCSTNIEVPDTEIENMGLIALVNVLLKPVNFVLEVAYLDRSPGSQLNMYRFPEEANNQDESTLGTIIYLLFRPTHYDILYSSPPVFSAIPAPQAPVSVQVHRVAGFTDNANVTSTQDDLRMYSTVDFGALAAMIPGFGASPPMTTGLPVTNSFVPAPQQSIPWAQQFDGGMTAPSPQPPPRLPSIAAPISPPSHQTSMSPHSPIGARQVMLPEPTLLPPTSECTIRFSPMQLEYNGSQSNYPEPTFQVTTNTFKNSVWNRAHFGNPDFHPEEWNPEDENIDGRFGSKKKCARH